MEKLWHLQSTFVIISSLNPSQKCGNGEIGNNFSRGNKEITGNEEIGIIFYKGNRK